MNLSPHATASHWSARYVGRLWEPPVIDKETGAVIKRGFNCWHLAQEAQADQFGRDLPDVSIGTPEDQTAALQRVTKKWRQVPSDAASQMAEGDLMTMIGDAGLHIAVVVDRTRVLHNVGGINEQGRAFGCVRIDAVAELGSVGTGYGHLQLWRAV